jgi:iron uptake system EfeUOB component EfeO/EfeM
MFTRSGRVHVVVGILALGVLASCSSDAADVTVNVTGTNDGCSMSADELAAGTIGFEFTNEADDVNELYVVQADGDVVGEVENVTTGTTRTLTADLVAGDYLVRCKPGQSGDGIESSFRVLGETNSG